MAKQRAVKRAAKPALCPCHSGARYDVCCRPWHEGQFPATAVLLMRSRYSAYALGNVRYIIATTHPASPLQQTDQAAWRRELRQFCQQTTFLSLHIVANGEHLARAGEWTTVTFRAGLIQGGQDASYTEQSLFERVAGRWLYMTAL